jgi:uncharacterized RDD family membrane protein YckC
MRRPDNEPLLFDLPLDRPARDDETEPLLDRQPPRPERPARTERTDRPEAPPPPRQPQSPRAARTGEAPPLGPARAPRLPLASAAALAAQARAAQLPLAVRAGEETAEGRADEPAGPSGQRAAGPAIGRRLAAAAADLLVHAAVTVLALAGCAYLGAVPALRDWPAVAVFVLSFSFLYTVVPLAFWGHTLGMTWAGLSAESVDGEPLSFDQTARRWLGALLTVATLGLPLLLALGGHSLADRLSGSRTLIA